MIKRTLTEFAPLTRANKIRNMTPLEISKLSLG